MPTQKPRWRTATINGKTVTYAVTQRGGRRVVLIKKAG
jgi:hypothetical protein